MTTPGHAPACLDPGGVSHDGPTVHQTDFLRFRYIPGMAYASMTEEELRSKFLPPGPRCTCTRKITEIRDASGVLRESYFVSEWGPGWTSTTKVVPWTFDFEHIPDCNRFRYEPPLPDIKALEELYRRLAPTHVGNGTYNGPFAFTLTKSPKDPQTVSDMINAVKKLMSQKSCPVKKYAWYLEYKGVDVDGLPAHPHIHGMYETQSGGRIEKKHFMRYWKLWDPCEGKGPKAQRLGAGFRGGFHRPVISEEGYFKYIAKDGGIGDSDGLD